MFIPMARGSAVRHDPASSSDSDDESPLSHIDAVAAGGPRYRIGLFNGDVHTI
jgi:hypothetical protein